MADNLYAQFETEHGGYRVIVEFPFKTDDEAVIHEEVRQILSNLLREQIAQMNSF